MDPQFPKVDLTSIMEWARKWQLRVNAEKCESMRITHLRDNSTTDYTLSKSLKDVDTFTDLSVTILVKDLSRGNHILEYAVPVWNLFLAKDIHILKS
ncbi:hypothetical protein pdam_00008626 [Pocillopora damicornis]|uniref:Reverse transcriptase domain-containing protein n=1 Tax=Pocillopora damicornis TaxID=46731 RepID=A0A3M6U7W3_POCDA|nr:hypothetical protein pdam_00008626 [Pocillopora damicornis]